MFRTLRRCLILALLMALAPAMPSLAHGDPVTCDQLRDEPGTAAFIWVGSFMSPTIPGAVRGCYFKSGERVSIEVDIVLENGERRTLSATATVDDHGEFDAALLDREQRPAYVDSILGYVVTATGNMGSAASFARGNKPMVEVDPRGPGGEPPMASCTAYHLEGYGFQPGEKVHIEGSIALPGGEVVQLPAVDARAGAGMEVGPDYFPLGYFMAGLVYKGDSSDLIGGAITVTATGNQGSQATMTAGPRSCVELELATPQNPVFRVVGHNFQAGERIRVDANLLDDCDQPLFTFERMEVQADTGGTFEARFEYAGSPSDVKNYTFFAKVTSSRGVVFDGGAVGGSGRLSPDCDIPTTDPGGPGAPPPNDQQGGDEQDDQASGDDAQHDQQGDAGNTQEKPSAEPTAAPIPNAQPTENGKAAVGVGQSPKEQLPRALPSTGGGIPARDAAGMVVLLAASAYGLVRVRRHYVR